MNDDNLILWILTIGAFLLIAWTAYDFSQLEKDIEALKEEFDAIQENYAKRECRMEEHVRKIILNKNTESQEVGPGHISTSLIDSIVGNPTIIRFQWHFYAYQTWLCDMEQDVYDGGGAVISYLDIGLDEEAICIFTWQEEVCEIR